MDIHVDFEPSENGSLKHASWDRLACLLRHWTWANEAMATFDRELATGFGDEDDPMSDHPFGAFYHWCALLCGLGEAALEQGLLPEPQLDAVRGDLEASLPGLRACRDLLVVIPASLEEHPRVVELLRMKRRLGDCRGSTTHSEKHCARNGCRERSTHSIIEDPTCPKAGTR